jgi:hypothetical protein
LNRLEPPVGVVPGAGFVEEESTLPKSDIVRVGQSCRGSFDGRVKMVGRGLDGGGVVEGCFFVVVVVYSREFEAGG